MEAQHSTRRKCMYKMPPVTVACPDMGILTNSVLGHGCGPLAEPFLSTYVFTNCVEFFEEKKLFELYLSFPLLRTQEKRKFHD